MRATLVLSSLIPLALQFPLALQAQPALERLESQLRDAPASAPREPGYLGVITRDVPPPGSYIEIRELVADGPAASAGLKVGDLIIRVDNEPARRMDDLASVLKRSAAGDRLEFTILRGQDEHRLLVTLGRRPPPAERKFEQFGEIRPLAPKNTQELPAPAPRTVEKPDNSATDDGPVMVAPNEPMQPARSTTESRIDLLERRVAELERRLAELEQLLQQRP